MSIFLERFTSRVGKALRTTLSLLELLVSLIILIVSPLALLFLISSQAKWALTLGTLSTAAHVVWRTQFDGWRESASLDSMGIKGHAKLLFLVLCLNCMFWGLLLASLIPAGWISAFNGTAPAWLADHDWAQWSGPFSRSIEAFVTGSLIHLLAHLLALMPFVLAPLLVVAIVLRLLVGRVRDYNLAVMYVLVAALFICFIGYFLFGDSLAWLFWGINGYILWKGGDWLKLLSILLIGFMPFRIAALLRTGSWLRHCIAEYEKLSKEKS